MAVLIGMFESDNYNWRSMTSPGITGLFNEHCLGSGAANLMMCYPGDNTFDGVLTTVRLMAENPFHSVTTTVEINGEGSSVFTAVERLCYRFIMRLCTVALQFHCGSVFVTFSSRFHYGFITVSLPFQDGFITYRGNQL